MIYRKDSPKVCGINAALPLRCVAILHNFYLSWNHSYYIGFVLIMISFDQGCLEAKVGSEMQHVKMHKHPPILIDFEIDETF